MTLVFTENNLFHYISICTSLSYEIAMSTNRAILVEAFDLEKPVLAVKDLPIPTPKDDEILVKITHRPVRTSAYGFGRREDTVRCPAIERSSPITRVG